jgi:hypothetical protein
MNHTPRASERPEHAWLATLVRELFQTENSARLHPVVEAERLGEVAPAQALRAVAAHAAEALEELPPLLARHDLPVSEAGKLVGAALSSLRDHFIDLLVNMEKSYRGTLIGMRHGVDLVELVQYTARAQGDEALARWCGAWLERRRPLVEEAARQLAWFAANPELARQPVKANPLAVGLRALIQGAEQLAERLRPGEGKQLGADAGREPG